MSVDVNAFRADASSMEVRHVLHDEGGLRDSSTGQGVKNRVSVCTPMMRARCSRSCGQVFGKQQFETSSDSMPSASCQIAVVAARCRVLR